MLSVLARVARAGSAFGGEAWLRVAAPIFMVVATLLVADLVRWIFPAGGVFLLLLLPVLVTSLLLGAWSGLLALVLGIAGALLLAAVRDHPWLTNQTDVLRAVPYVLIGGFIVLMAWVLRESLRHEPAPRPATQPSSLIEPLTPREAEVLGLAASGLTIAEISGRLYVSRNTVKSHLAHAYAKLGAHNRVEAVAAGLHAGMIDEKVLVSRAAHITAGLTRTATRRRRTHPPSP